MTSFTSRTHGTGTAPEATYGFPAGSGPTLVDVELTRVTSHGWRISDRRLPLGDPFRLLGYVEHCNGEYEIMQLSSQFEWHTAISLEAAVEFVLSTATAMAQARLGCELAWVA